MKTLNFKENEVKELYFYNEDDIDITYNLEKNSKLVVYHYASDIDGNIIVNLNGEGATLEYHFSTINYNKHLVKIIVNHNVGETSSNIYNHAINIQDKKLVFDITGKVLNTSSKCTVNQENQIINLSDGEGVILPNLLIDNYDVVSNHAAYIGKFKDELLYYLMSRGISKNSAIKILTKSLLINGGDINNKELNKFLDKINNL